MSATNGQFMAWAERAGYSTSAIDLLLSMPARLDDPDIIEQEVPLLFKAINDRSDKLSNYPIWMWWTVSKK